MNLAEVKEHIFKTGYSYQLEQMIGSHGNLRIIKKPNKIIFLIKISEYHRSGVNNKTNINPSDFIFYFFKEFFNHDKFSSFKQSIEFIPIKYKYKYQTYCLDDSASYSNTCNFLNIKLKYEDFYESYKNVFDNLIFA